MKSKNGKRCAGSRISSGVRMSALSSSIRPKARICIEMLEAAGYHGDPAIADVKRQRMVQRLDEAGK